MAFCPTCKTEYTNDIKYCRKCNIDLVDLLPEDSSEKDAGSTELVELVEFSNVSEAEMIKELLGTNGIQTVQRGEVDPIGIVSGAEPITLLVEEKDLRRARELYEAYFSLNDTEESPSDEDD
jgi:hypothetical protein